MSSLQVVANPARRPAAPFLAEVGERVRAARERKGFSRRMVSERSQVSQRYLAQLEAGDGNISIALLHRVAEALDERIENFVGERHAPEAAEIAARWSVASEAQRERALAILSEP